MKKINQHKMQLISGGLSCIAVGVLSVIPFYALAFALGGEYERCWNS